MKRIRYLKGNSILIGPFTITCSGVLYTELMQQNAKIQEFISKGILEVFDDTSQDQNKNDSVNSAFFAEEVVSVSTPESSEIPTSFEQSFDPIFADTKSQESPYVALDSTPAVSAVTETDSVSVTPYTPFVTLQAEHPDKSDVYNSTVLKTSQSSVADEVCVVTTSSENPALKETVPLSKSVASELEELKKELEEIVKEPEVKPPLQKKS